MGEFDQEWFKEGYEANCREKPCAPPDEYRANAAVYWVKGWEYANLMRGMGRLPTPAESRS